MVLWEEAMRVHPIFGVPLGENMNLWSFGVECEEGL
jgi:hypothetical protein